MILSNLPAIQVVLPLLGAVICACVRRGVIAWGVTLWVALAMPIVAALILAQVYDGSVISYAMGGWPPPIGIEYRVDIANASMLLLVSAIAAVVVPYAKQSVEAEIAPENHAWDYA
ncbi:MAG: monovalent cation/H+ antiporter subunit D family protein, partial [Alphaproteobacteria bacterium]